MIECLSFFVFVFSYLYTRKLNLTGHNAFQCLFAAQHFEIHCLEKKCVEHITKCINPRNVGYYMKEAINFKSEILQMKCKLFFQNNTRTTLSFASLVNMPQSILSAVLDEEHVNISEDELFCYVERWMKAKCIEQELELTGSNMRKVLGDALYKVRFPTMNLNSFAYRINNIEGFLTDTEKWSIFKKMTLQNNEHVHCDFLSKPRMRSDVARKTSCPYSRPTKSVTPK